MTRSGYREPARLGRTGQTVADLSESYTRRLRYTCIDSEKGGVGEARPDF